MSRAARKATAAGHPASQQLETGNIAAKEHSQPLRSNSVPFKMLIALVLCIAVYVGTMGELSFKAAIPQVTIRPSSSTEKSERKLMGSVHPQGVGDRSCRGPLEKELAELPALVSIQKWTSAKERPRESISLVTQLSIDRLPSLENQCITWPDHLVAVVYIPMVGNSTGGPPLLPLYRHTTLDDVIRGIDSFHNFMETTAACAFHIELVGQFVAPAMFPGPYPINSLRNRALSLCPTDLAIPVDADFVATPLLGLPGPGYRDPEVFKQMEAMAAQKQALILPALELTNKWQDLTLARNTARDLVIAGKKMAVGALLSGAVAPYRAPDDPLVRDISNITRWSRITSPSVYEVALDPHSEPCVLLSLSKVPWFDERFLDSTGGASTWFSHLAASKFSFLVHPFGFVVHVPHTRPVPSSQYMQAQQKLRQGRMELLRQHVVAEINGKIYVPVLRDCPTAENAVEDLSANATDAAATHLEADDNANVEAAAAAAAVVEEVDQAKESKQEGVTAAAIRKDKINSDSKKGSSTSEAVTL